MNGISGFSSVNRYQNYMQPPPMKEGSSPAEKFTTADSDSDGKLSQTELDAFATQFAADTGQTLDVSSAISTYDSDSDSGLSQEEMDSFMRATMQQNMGSFGMQGMGGMQNGMGSMGGGGQPDLFTALDTDSSGGVSESELSTWATNMSGETGNTIDTSSAISSYDEDGDGELSSDELKSFLDASGVKPPAPPDSGKTSSTQATDVISQYDTDGDGVLSSTELQSYLDENSGSSTQSYVQNALNSYLSNMMDMFSYQNGNQNSNSHINSSV